MPPYVLYGYLYWPGTPCTVARGMITTLEQSLEAEKAQRTGSAHDSTDLQRQIREMEKIIKARFPDMASIFADPYHAGTMLPFSRANRHTRGNLWKGGGT